MKRACAALVLAWMLACAHAHAEEAWVYEAKGLGGRGCLIFVTHLSPHPVIHSDRIARCLSSASVIAYETDPTVSSSIWKGFERKPGEMSVKDIEVDSPRLKAALQAAGYAPSEIEYILALHPAGIYRALFYSKALASKTVLYPNIDIEIAKKYRNEGMEIVSLEGMPAFYRNEKNIDEKRLSDYIGRLCDIYLSPSRLGALSAEIEDYVKSISVLPDVDSSYRRKVEFNTRILGLPLDSVFHDVDDRNGVIAEGIVHTLQTHKNSVMFVGADHLGGAKGLLHLIAARNVDLKLIE